MKKGEEEENTDTSLWMVTFADLLGLLLTFFVLLFALKALDKGKLDEFLGYFRDGGMGILESGEEMPVTSGKISDELAIKDEIVSFEELKRVINGSLRNAKIEDKVSVRQDARGLILTISDVILFEGGSSEIRTEALSTLDKLSEVLRKIRHHIIVEGHTDNVPISTSAFPSNWELSTDRANKVLRYLVESRGLVPERFSAAGYGDTKPVAPNSSPENRKLNRRVELILNSEDVGYQ